MAMNVTVSVQQHATVTCEYTEHARVGAYLRDSGWSVKTTFLEPLVEGKCMVEATRPETRIDMRDVAAELAAGFEA